MFATLPNVHDCSALAAASRERPAPRACDASRGGRPPRPVPADFAARWPQVGWEGATLEWGTHSRVIARWLAECGRERLIAARVAFLESQRALRDRERRKTYGMAR